MVKQIRRGLRALDKDKEISVGGRTTNTEVTISEGSEGDSAEDVGRSILSNNGSDGLAGGGGSFSGGPVGTGKPVCYSGKACNNNAKGYTVG